MRPLLFALALNFILAGLIGFLTLTTIWEAEDAMDCPLLEGCRNGR